jgi:TolB protein
MHLPGRRGLPRRVFALAAIAVVVAVAVAAATASATPPGKNGRIAFRRFFDADQSWGAVFAVSADGKQMRRVTSPPQGVLDDQPEWAPDGSAIAFTRCPPAPGLCHAFVVAPDGTNLAPIGALCAAGATEETCPNDSSPSFSRDSKQIVLIQSTGPIKPDANGESWIQYQAIALANRDGSGRRVIYQSEPFMFGLDFPVFSPDGRRIVFERMNSGFSPHAGQRAVYVVGADGWSPRRLTPWAENAGDNPDWSPDGKWILFHTYVDDARHQAQIFLIHPDGKGRKQLTHFPAGTHVASSTFSPDGKWVAISKGPEGGNIDVYVMRIDGTHLRRITHSPLWESAPDWGPR